MADAPPPPPHEQSHRRGGSGLTMGPLRTDNNTRPGSCLRPPPPPDRVGVWSPRPRAPAGHLDRRADCKGRCSTLRPAGEAPTVTRSRPAGNRRPSLIAQPRSVASAGPADRPVCAGLCGPRRRSSGTASDAGSGSVPGAGGGGREGAGNRTSATASPAHPKGRRRQRVATEEAHRARRRRGGGRPGRWPFSRKF